MSVDSSPSAAVNVFVRVRAHPEATTKSAIEVTTSGKVALNGSRSFQFDKGHTGVVTQRQVFEVVGRPTLGAFLDGYNGTILCYGQTGAGKTFTMTGGSQSEEERGLLPRILEEAFSALARRQQRDESECGTFYRSTCSMSEIYNDQIIDLLAGGSASSRPLRIREAPEPRGTFVEGLREVRLRSAREALQAVAAGSRRRTVHATAMNETSSRSHAVFTLRLERVTPEVQRL